MTLSVLHLLKKDFRLTRSYLAAWWGLLLLKAYGVVFDVDNLRHPQPLPRYNPAAPQAMSFHQMVMELLPLGLFLLTYLSPLLLGFIVSQVLKADSPIDERALWRTRPVAGRTILQAKLLFLGLIGIAVPIAIETYLRLRFGFDVRECLRGAAETAVIYAAWMGLIASAALLFKKTFTGVLTYVAIVIVGCFGCAFLAHFDWLSDNFDPTPRRGVFGIGTGFILTALAAVAVLVVARQMYNGANRWRGVKTLAYGLVLAVFAAGACRELFFLNHPAPYPRDENLKLTLQARSDESNPTQPNDIALSLNMVTNGAVNVTTDNPDGIGYTIYGRLKDGNFPALKDQVLLVEQLHSAFSWPGPKVPTLMNAFENLNDSIGLINAPAAYAAAGYGRLAWKSEDNTASLPLAYPTGAELNHLQKEPAHWSGEINCESGHLVTVADVQPQGGSWQEGSIFNAIDLFDSPTPPYKHKCSIYFRDFAPAYYLLAPPPGEYALHVFLLFNPRTKECIEASRYSNSNYREPSMAQPYFSVLGLAYHELNFDFNQPLDESGRVRPTPTSDEDIKAWIAESHLVVLRFDPSRRFSFPLTIDPFLVPKNTPLTQVGR